MVRSTVSLLVTALVMAVSAQPTNAQQQPTIVSRSAPATTAPSSLDPVEFERFQRARRNFDALARGFIRVADLGPQDLQDVLELDRLLRGGVLDQRSFAQRCVDDEVQRLNGRPSELAWRVIMLKCREVGN